MRTMLVVRPTLPNLTNLPVDEAVAGTYPPMEEAVPGTYPPMEEAVPGSYPPVDQAVAGTYPPVDVTVAGTYPPEDEADHAVPVSARAPQLDAPLSVRGARDHVAGAAAVSGDKGRFNICPRFTVFPTV